MDLFASLRDNAVPRSYLGSASFDLSANGSNVLGGPAFRQKYQWVISSILSTEDAERLDALFYYWDLDRASGRSAACGIIDETWREDVSTNAVFITPPVFSRLAPELTLVSLGLQEV